MSRVTDHPFAEDPEAPDKCLCGVKQKFHEGPIERTCHCGECSYCTELWPPRCDGDSKDASIRAGQRGQRFQREAILTWKLQKIREIIFRISSDDDISPDDLAFHYGRIEELSK